MSAVSAVCLDVAVNRGKEFTYDLLMYTAGRSHHIQGAVDQFGTFSFREGIDIIDRVNCALLVNGIRSSFLVKNRKKYADIIIIPGWEGEVNGDRKIYRESHGI